MAPKRTTHPSTPANHLSAPAPGDDARGRLIIAGLKLFSERGFANTSVRDLAALAGVNLAAISYYFGDKEGLYQAVFFEPLMAYCPALADPGNLEAFEQRYSGSLSSALEVFYRDFLGPLNAGGEARQVMRLHFREMVDPTGVWERFFENEILPQHNLLSRLLLRELGLEAVDIDLHRLIFALVGMPIYYFVGFDVMDRIAPAVTSSPEAIETCVHRLVGFAEAMIEAEKKRRTATG